jgi:hypothetical protein
MSSEYPATIRIDKNEGSESSPTTARRTAVPSFAIQSLHTSMLHVSPPARRCGAEESSLMEANGVLGREKPAK